MERRRKTWKGAERRGKAQKDVGRRENNRQGISMIPINSVREDEQGVEHSGENEVHSLYAKVDRVKTAGIGGGYGRDK